VSRVFDVRLHQQSYSIPKKQRHQTEGSARDNRSHGPVKSVEHYVEAEAKTDPKGEQCKSCEQSRGTMQSKRILALLRDEVMHRWGNEQANGYSH
jgi:hypothetical protein